MYKITHNIIHVTKDKYLRPTRKREHVETHDFKYCIDLPSNDIYKFLSFQEKIVSQFARLVSYSTILKFH